MLLVCGIREADGLQSSWVGQAVDVEHCQDLAAALFLVGQSAPDVVVVGDSPSAFGAVEFLLALRQVDTETPVVVGIEDSRLSLGPNVLAAGATVVVRRPFAAGDLLRLLESGVPSGGRFRVRPVPIDLGRLRVEGAAPRMWVDGAERVVPPMEFVLLRYLAERHGEIVSREELVCAGWGDRAALPSNSLSVHMTRLRRRFREPTGQDWIKALRGFGYRLLVPERPPARAAGEGA